MTDSCADQNPLQRDPVSPQCVATFDEMELDANLVRGIYSYGFEQPSRIQQLAIMPMKGRNDILAQSQSGTGKRVHLQ